MAAVRPEQVLQVLHGYRSYGRLMPRKLLRSNQPRGSLFAPGAKTNLISTFGRWFFAKNAESGYFGCILAEALIDDCLVGRSTPRLQSSVTAETEKTGRFNSEERDPDIPRNEEQGQTKVSSRKIQ